MQTLKTVSDQNGKVHVADVIRLLVSRIGIGYNFEAKPVATGTEIVVSSKSSLAEIYTTQKKMRHGHIYSE